MKRIVIFGATSAIAAATARLWAIQGHQMVLVGRNQSALQSLAQDLQVRGATKTDTLVADLNDLEQHAELIQQATDSLDQLDVALIAHGVLGDQTAGEREFSVALEDITTNALSTLSLLTHLANRFEAQGSGSLVAIGSVAGDRGRSSNYVYGSAKAAVSAFMQGLRQRLHKSGVHVLTVKPGFVDSPMTQGFDKNFLWVSPDQVADRIVNSVSKKHEVLYAPWFWRLIMLVIKSVPEFIFKRATL